MFAQILESLSKISDISRTKILTRFKITDMRHLDKDFLMALHYTQWGYFVKKRRPAGRLAYPWSGQVLEVAVSANLPSSSAGPDPHLTLQCLYM